MFISYFFCIFAPIKIGYNMQVDEKLYAEIKQYCELNGLKIKPFISDLLRNAFNREKFGDRPFQKKCELTQPIIENETKEDKKAVFYEIDIIPKEEKDNLIPNNKVENDEIKIENLNKTKKRKLN